MELLRLHDKCSALLAHAPNSTFDHLEIITIKIHQFGLLRTWPLGQARSVAMDSINAADNAADLRKSLDSDVATQLFSLLIAAQNTPDRPPPALMNFLCVKSFSLS
ncbi:hypothetical protein [Burkholderia sp. RS02]|uniref:hypothetical protein n=1 Tax=unclassified Burkholderia TaxID=2613784 RepID=UPI0032187809